MINNIKRIIATALLITAISCNCDDVNGVSSNVLVVGVEDDDSGLKRASLWENGKQSFLSSIGSYASDIKVVGEDVYIAITEVSTNVSKVLKNGQVLFQSSGTRPSVFTSLFIDGSDVYAAGYVSLQTRTIATYWKNGEEVNIENEGSQISSIYVSQGIIHMCGIKNDVANSNFRATYWRNSIATFLNTSVNRSNANKLYVYGDDVYVVGFVYENGNKAKLWKNGEEIDYSTDYDYSTNTDILVDFGNVYITQTASNEQGGDENYAILLKNNQKTILYTINDDLGDTSALGVTKQGDSFFVLGTFTNYSISNKEYLIVWKNNKELFKTELIDANIKAIAVKN